MYVISYNGMLRFHGTYSPVPHAPNYVVNKKKQAQGVTSLAGDDYEKKRKDDNQKIYHVKFNLNSPSGSRTQSLGVPNKFLLSQQ